MMVNVFGKKIVCIYISLSLIILEKKTEDPDRCILRSFIFPNGNYNMQKHFPEQLSNIHVQESVIKNHAH